MGTQPARCGGATLQTANGKEEVISVSASEVPKSPFETEGTIFNDTSFFRAQKNPISLFLFKQPFKFSARTVFPHTIKQCLPSAKQPFAHPKLHHTVSFGCSCVPGRRAARSLECSGVMPAPCGLVPSGSAAETQPLRTCHHLGAGSFCHQYA